MEIGNFLYRVELSTLYTLTVHYYTILWNTKLLQINIYILNYSTEKNYAYIYFIS